MAGTSTTPEALADLRSALGVWATSSAGIARQASASATALVAEVEAAVRARSTKRAALEAALRAAKEERARLARELQLATTSLEDARRALQSATEAARGAQNLQRRIDESTSSRVPRASRALAHKLEALSDYTAAAVPSSAATPTATGPVSSGENLGVPGIANVPIAQARFEDNPIKDGYHREGADITDYRWAVETWESIVRPGVLAGKTREDFERRDNEQGQYTGYRRTAGVYDMFLGSNPVHFTRRADGTLDVPSGRHRVQIAQQLGITHLPGRLDG